MNEYIQKELRYIKDILYVIRDNQNEMRNSILNIEASQKRQEIHNTFITNVYFYIRDKLFNTEDPNRSLLAEDSDGALRVNGRNSNDNIDIIIDSARNELLDICDFV